MARPPKYKREITDLRCQRCGHTFRSSFLYVSQDTSDRGMLGWEVDSFDGLTCPVCGSQIVRLAHR